MTTERIIELTQGEIMRQNALANASGEEIIKRDHIEVATALEMLLCFITPENAV